MGRKDRKLYHAKKSAATSATTNTKEYHAPTDGLEDQFFTFGKSKDASKFEVGKENWSNTLPHRPRTMELMMHGPLRPRRSRFTSNQMSLLSQLNSSTI